MRRLEIFLAIVLALFGAGVSAGQGLVVNGWVLGFWGAAIAVILFGLLFHRHDRTLDVSLGVLGEISEVRNPRALEQPSIENEQRSDARPDVVVLPPKEGDAVYGIEWRPLLNHAINTWAMTPEGHTLEDAQPMFRLKNNGSVGVTDVSAIWSVREEPPIEDVCLGSNDFKAFHPSIEDKMFVLRNPTDSHQQVGIPVDDRVSVDISFCPPTPTSDETTPLRLPGSIINNLAIRMIAATRPQWEPFIYPPVVSVDLEYRVGRKRYERKFVVQVRLMFLGDAHLSAPGLPMRPEAAASARDFRGNIVDFTVKERL